MDDLIVETSKQGRVYIQAKRFVNLSSSSTSDLAKSIDQFVRQYLASRISADEVTAIGASLRPSEDRLVLVTGSRSPATVTEHLRSALIRVRQLLPTNNLWEADWSEREGRALSRVKGRLTASWQRRAERAPTEAELREILSLMYVTRLEVEPGGRDERQAQTLLRTAVVQEPANASVAWSSLVVRCIQLATNRGAANRASLQQCLQTQGIRLHPTRSFRGDIEALKRASRQSLALGEDNAQIRLGNEIVRITRGYAPEILGLTESTSLLVIGEPGSGKSGVLHGYAQVAAIEGRDVVYLPADRLRGESVGQLSASLGLSHPIDEVLLNWPVAHTGVLLLDSLDATRDEYDARAIRDLIGLIASSSERWVVVAAIRRFDLRYGRELRGLFEGTTESSFAIPEFSDVRHVFVDSLSDEEIAQVAGQSPSLGALIRGAPEPLQRLLRVPFNLRLAAELIQSGASSDDLSRVTTQSELLDRYWIARVVRTDGLRDARESVLRSCCREMVGSRSLRIERSQVATDRDASETLHDLLGENVLTEWQPRSGAPVNSSIVLFSHHILFDYAVARLLLRIEASDLASLFAEDPALALVVSPSIRLHFAWLWDSSGSRRAFWEVQFEVAKRDDVPRIARLIGPGIAAEQSREVADLLPLAARLGAESVDAEVLSSAHHLISALQILQEDGVSTAGGRPWAALCASLSASLNESTSEVLRRLLATVIDDRDRFSHEERTAAGVAARALFRFHCSYHPNDRVLAGSLGFVLSSFASSVEESRSLVLEELQDATLRTRGFLTLGVLANAVPALLEIDRSLVEQIYTTAFRFEEESEETTPMGSSRVLPMVSNRRQDYEHSQWELGQSFEQICAADPVLATEVLISTLEGYVVSRHPYIGPSPATIEFTFRGGVAWFRSDGSAVWDASDVYKHDPAMKMLEHWVDKLENAWSHESEVLTGVLEVVRSRNELALVWRRLLICGSRTPETLGRELLGLACEERLLTCLDTTYQAGELIRALHPIAEPRERERIESAVLRIGVDASPDTAEALEEIRGRIFSCIENENAVLPETRERIEERVSRGDVRENVPPFVMTSSMEPFDEDDELAERGVPIDDPANATLRERLALVREFANGQMNSIPGAEETAAVIPEMRAVLRVLAGASGVHPELADRALGTVAAAAACIARTGDLAHDEGEEPFVRSVLMRASRHRIPEPCEESDKSFDRFQGWGGASPRIEAAAGLVDRAARGGLADPELRSRLMELLRDPVPAVRYQIARRLASLYQADASLVWETALTVAREDTSIGVLRGLLDALQRFSWIEPDKTVQVLNAVSDRPAVQGADSKVREAVAEIVVTLAIRWDHRACQTRLEVYIADPGAYRVECVQAGGSVRRGLVYKINDPDDREAAGVRSRARALYARLISDATARYESGVLSLREGDLLEEVRRGTEDRVREEASLLDLCAREIYFASGAFERGSGARQPASDEDLPTARQFWSEVKPVAELVAEVPIPSVTHHLLQLLEYLAPVDPEGVFKLVARVVAAGGRGGYQYERVGVGLIVRLVEWYLADHRVLFRESEELRQALIGILDTFVEAGWPEVRRLVYRLDQIFR